MKKSIKWMTILMVCGWVMGVGGIRQAVAAKVKKEIHKNFTLRAGGELTVDNVNGAIEIVSWEKESVDVNAEIVVKHPNRRRAEDYLDLVEVHFDRDDSYLGISVDYPERGRGGILSWLFGDRKPEVSVRFQIKVPEKTDLKLTAVNGKVVVENVAGKVDTKTTNGSVRLKDVFGDVSCRTVNGSISVRLERDSRFNEMTLRTVNGGIRLAIPSDLKATIEASTVNGGISTELPLEVSGRFTRRSLRGKLNGGGANVLMKTVNGGITIQASDQ